MNLETTPYLPQSENWPQSGRVILAQYDHDSVVVYQAYRPEIGHFAVKNGFLGGEFKLSRMSWIKPNFLWMMYRCGWAIKEGQEVVLAIRIRRDAFDEILSLAVHSSYQQEIYESRDAWKDLVSASDVRLQWDPDHSPDGGKHERRAIQLGLRGSVLEKYSRQWIIEIEDVTEFVTKQRANATAERYDELVVPTERVYPVSDKLTLERLKLDYAV